MLLDWQQHWNIQAAISSVPNGSYRVYLYVMQDWNDPAPPTVTFTVEGVTAGTYTAGGAGAWQKLGPYAITMSDGTLNITSNNIANLAGIEIEQVITATPTPTRTPTFTPLPTGTPTSTPVATPVPQGAGSFTLSVTIDGNGNRLVQITTVAQGGVTIVTNPWPEPNTPITNNVGGCLTQLGGFACWFGRPGQINITLPPEITYIHVLQEDQGVRTWVAP
jgi:hypothetical protein